VRTVIEAEPYDLCLADRGDGVGSGIESKTGSETVGRITRTGGLARNKTHHRFVSQYAERLEKLKPLFFG
jgi:hypothetical protein